MNIAKENKFTKYVIYVVIGIASIIIISTIGSTIRIQTSDAYPIAKRHILNDEYVLKEFGKIGNFGPFPLGGFKMLNGIDYAQIETKVEGSKKKGKVIVKMEKIDSEWIVNEILIVND